MSLAISVIMPVYNGEKFIASALNSICREADDNLEVVVVDDGSTDRTLEILDKFRNQLSLRVLTPGRRGNWVAVTNLGLREASAEWACFLHHDDHWLPGRINRVRDLATNAEGSLVLHNAMFVGPDDQDLGPWTCPLSGPIVTSQQFLEALLVQNFIAISSPLFRRKAVLDSGGMDESLWHTADWDLWLRLGSLGPVCFSNEILTVFRVHDESQTSARALRPGEWEEQLTTVLDRHLPSLTSSHRQKRAQQLALASIGINANLAAASRGDSTNWARSVGHFVRLGPLGWMDYVRTSRISQRLGARLKVRYGRRVQRGPVLSSTTNS